MRSRGVLVSLVIHVVVFGIAMQAAKRSAARRIATAVVSEKKKAKPKEEEKPKPKPKPKAAPTPSVAPVETHAAPSKAAPEPVAPAQTNIEMSNDEGPGIVVPPKNAPKNAPSGNAPSGNKPSTAKKEKAASKEDNPEEDTCTEAPSKPVPVQRTEIGYTDEARANNVEGRLVLRITVGADGSVLKVEVLSKVDPQLDAAVVAVVKQWVFKPSMRCGRAMAGGVYTMAKDFELSD